MAPPMMPASSTSREHDDGRESRAGPAQRGRGEQRTGDHLALAADVDDVRPEGDGDADADQQERCRLQGRPDQGIRTAEGSREHRVESLDRIGVQPQQDDGADEECDDDGPMGTRYPPSRGLDSESTVELGTRATRLAPLWLSKPAGVIHRRSEACRNLPICQPGAASPRGDAGHLQIAPGLTGVPPSEDADRHASPPTGEGTSRHDHGTARQGLVPAQRRTGVGGRRARASAGRAARGTGCDLAQGRLLSIRPMRRLHGARRRQGTRQLLYFARQGRGSRGDHTRRFRPGGAGPPTQRPSPPTVPCSAASASPASWFVSRR